MIQTSLLAQGMVAAVASTHRSASTSYPGVPLNLSSSLPTTLFLAEEPLKGVSFGAKSKNLFLLDLTFLPPTQHSRRNRLGEPPPCASLCLPAAYDGFAGRGRDAGDRRLPPRHQRQAGRQPQETKGRRNHRLP